MKRALSFSLSFILILAAPLLQNAGAAEPSAQGAARQEILILNSYHPGYAFSDEEQAGVIDVLRGKDKNWVPVIEYLDMKRFPDGKHLMELKRLFYLKYQNRKFSVVIAMDNPALEFAVDNQSELFGNAPIVFCGINNFNPSLLKGHDNVTGIVEAIDIAGTIELMLRLHPDTREIFSPHDHTATGLAVRKELEGLAPRFGPKVRFRFTDPLTMEELLKEIERLQNDSLVLEIGFITDRAGRTFGISETTKLFSEHSPVPIYSTYEQRLGFGLVGGKLLSPRLHGAGGARIALRVLAGERASTIPIVLQSDSQYMFDHAVMSRFGIPLSALPEGSTVINRPVSFFATHRAVILTALGIIGLLLIIIVLLTINSLQRRRSLEKIRRSEELFKAITSNNPDHLIVQDRDLRYSFVMNPQLGLTPGDMIGKTDQDFLSKENADRLTGIKKEVLKSGCPVHMEVPLRSPTGGQEFFDGSYIPRFDEKGQIDGLIGYFRNVTDRRRAEERLKESEAQYRALFEGINDALFVHELDQEGMPGRFLQVNDVACRRLGYAREELLALSPREITIPEEYQRMADKRTDLATQKDILVETVHVAKGGRKIPVESNIRKFHYLGRQVALSISRDISDRKQVEEEKRVLEERLRRSEKMEALGTLAGGVAHDLNNILGIVVGYSEMLLDQVDKSSAIRREAETIMNGGLKAAAIVDDLLTLARRGVPNRSILNLNKIVADCQKSPEFTDLSFHRPGVVIKTDLDPDLLNISGSPVHLVKSLYNLISNASEATARGGVVTIRTSNQYLDKPIQGYDQIRAGDYVVLSVSDTGEGIHEADLKRIFEPFYTKKIMGKSGTGLGLAVVWGTVKDHNGYINVESEKGKGSTFTLYFPVTREEVAAEASAVAVSEYLGKGESILVVDDVKEQRDLAAGMLRMLNYNVSSVSGGEEAVAYLKEHRVDLMVLDMIMDPGMDGLDTYQCVLAIHPKQKAIIVSGFSESDRVKTAERLGAGAYVRKPYVKEKLGLAVRRELDRSHENV